MKTYTLIIALLIGSSSLFAQSKTVEEFRETNENGYNFFAYQSVLRMLNTQSNEDFNLLIKDLEYINVIISDSLGVSQKQVYSGMIKTIQTEGYEEIAMMDNKEMKGAIYEKETGKNSDWVAFMYTEGKSYALEMKGGLDLRYIGALHAIDEEKFKELVSNRGFN